MWFNKSDDKPYISEEVRAIASKEDDRKRLYNMNDADSEEFEVGDRKVRISTDTAPLKVVKIRRK